MCRGDDDDDDDDYVVEGARDTRKILLNGIALLYIYIICKIISVSHRLELCFLTVDVTQELLERVYTQILLKYRSSLVDPASSHMLVSKIKPCMSQCTPN